MKRTTTFSFIMALTMGLPMAYGQKVSGYEKVYYQDVQNTEMTDGSMSVKVKTNNAVSTADYHKFALSMENNSNDILFVDQDEMTFNFEFGERHPDGKPLLIMPNKSKTKTMNAEGGNEFLQEKFTFTTGGFYRIPVNGKTTVAEDFQLPAAKNNFTAGNFDVKLLKYKASTAEAKATFEVTYTGDDVAIVNAANLSVRATNRKTDEEVVYANDDKSDDMEVMRKGDKVKFNAVFHIEGRIVDMQFATMYIVWNNTFVESAMSPIPPVTLEIKMDPGLTEGKK